MLSDRDIRAALAAGKIKISPSVPDNAVQPASLDLHLANTFWVFPPSNEIFDPRSPITDDSHRTPTITDEFDIYPGQFVLASTTEHVSLGPAHAARIEGKSSLGRLGLFVHITAGFIDPGFAGNITLELLNVSGRPLRLHAGMKIAQLSIQELTSPAERPYGHPELGSKYQGQTVATPSLYHLNKDTEV